MNDLEILDSPKVYGRIKEQSNKIGFQMTSDTQVGSLLKTLVTSKPKANVLELGTGTGLSLAWILDGLDADGTIISIDNDEALKSVAALHFENDARVQFFCGDGAEWLSNYRGPLFDLIFADAWPGKYHDLEEALSLLKVGGFYIVDDMMPQTNWPEGHAEKAENLIKKLEDRLDFNLTKVNWSTGIIIGVKKN